MCLAHNCPMFVHEQRTMKILYVHMVHGQWAYSNTYVYTFSTYAIASCVQQEFHNIQKAVDVLIYLFHGLPPFSPSSSAFCPEGVT